MPNVIDEYLIKLGTVVDQAGLARFHNALREAAFVAETQSMRMAGSFLKAQSEIVAGFVAIGGAAIGLIDKTAMADQSFRLFALHMYMSKDAARGLKVATDALGVSMEDMAWDPELRGRAHQLLLDQKAMAPGKDYDEQMRKIRDVRFEFTRMHVELEYLGMNVVTEFMKGLGLGPDTLLTKLKEFNKWVIEKMPDIAHSIAKWFLPIWKDITEVGKAAGAVLADFGTMFTNVVGMLSGDKAIEGSTFNMEKFATAVQTVAHWFAVLVENMLKFTGTFTGLLAGGGVGGVVGSIIGGIAGLPLGPAGILAGIVSGGAAGSAIGAGAGAVTGGAWDFWRAGHGNGTAGSAAGVSSLDSLLHAIMMQESGGNQSAVSPKGAIGLMQLMPNTAAGLGVNPYNPTENMQGGERYFNQLLAHYGNNVADAVGAYNAGPGRMDKFLAGKATLPAETQNYISSVLGRAGGTGDVTVGSITIHVAKPNAVNEDVGRVVVDTVRQAQAKAVQRNIAQAQNLGWSA